MLSHRFFNSRCTFSGQIGVLLVLLLVPFNASFAQTIQELLEKSAKAAQTVDYKGTFIYSRGAETETMRIYRRNDADGFKERLLSLNGDASEIVRNQNGAWCYFPETKEGFFKFRDDGTYRMPIFDAMSIDKLGKHYSIMLGGRERVSNRWTQKVVFAPKDSFRYGLNLWIDEETGLLLRSDLLNEEMELVDSYMFVEIVMSEDISDSELVPIYSGEDYVWNFQVASKMHLPDNSTPSWVASVPDGFKKVKHVRGEFNHIEKEQIVYSDELATVSLFVQKLVQGDQDGYFVGDSKLGSVNAYGRVIAGYQVTVVGEVPAETVRVIGNSVQAKH